MKFYNPFKPHIVVFEDGYYGIRRYELKLLSFTFYSPITDIWLYQSYIESRIKYDNSLLEDRKFNIIKAKKLMNILTKSKVKCKVY